TQQYELAKVQEAKEIPSVKVLDAAEIPTKKSFPPRLLITVLGTMLGFAIAATWVLANRKWEGTDSSDPRKAFAQEVLSPVSARDSKFSRNGSDTHFIRQKFWARTSERKEGPPSAERKGGEGESE